MTDLLAKISVFLLAAIVTVPIAKFLRLGSVLGYLLAGMIIGPSVLGFLGGATQHHLHQVSEFGVVMMLFLIGLELKPSMLLKLRVPILGMGGLQMLLCTAVLAVMARGLGENLRQSLAIGMILALSSTAIVIQTLNEKKLLNTRGGRSVFSVLLFQDISVIPMLAILPLLTGFKIESSNQHLNPISAWLFSQPEYVRFLAIFLVLALIVFVGRFLSGYIFRFIISTGISDLFTASALITVVGVAYLMELLGLSAALGTFLAGVMLSESEYRHEIELSIEPFKGLLLGLFFMTVGAGIDFALLIADPVKITQWVVLLIVLKLFTLFVIGKIFRHKSMQSLLFACALAQGGEFAYVLFAFCQSNLILQGEQVKFLNLVVTLSMLATPILMIAYDAVYRHHNRHRANVLNQGSEEIEEVNPIIIAGYGSFGQVIGRMLTANSQKCTVLDNNPKVIETLKRFGHKVYYGDASKADLLKLAGAEQAKILIIAVGDDEITEKIIKTAHKYFPRLKIFVRAGGDRVSVYRLLEQRIDCIQRDNFLSALELAKKALIELGVHPYMAYRQARFFKEYDEEMLLTLYHEWKADPKLRQGQQAGEQYVSKTRELSESLVAVLRNDRSKNASDDHAWEPAPTEAEIIKKAIEEEKLAARQKEEAEKAVAVAIASAAMQQATEMDKSDAATEDKTDGSGEKEGK
ncbi:MAG: cation:proton antiporter [Cardiobacteriaceae bacterium]|nr:cation:proton antiporter [Cardiobacteriaceae bacterium]